MRVLLIVLMFLLASSATAENLYVCHGGDGSDPDQSSGINCSTAWDEADFNTPENWVSDPTANKIDPGDTVYLMDDGGNFVMASGSAVLITWGSGTEQNPVTITAYPGDTPVVDAEEARPYAFQLETTSSYVHVSNLIMEDAVQGNVFFRQGDYNWLSGCTVRNSASIGVLIDVNTTGAKIFNNTFHGNAAMSFCLYGGQDAEIYDNLITFTGSYVVVNVQGQGAGYTGAKFYRNWVDATAGGNTCTFFLHSMGIALFNNVILTDSARDVFKLTGQNGFDLDVEIYNNTIHGGGEFVELNVSGGAIDPSTTVKIKNNIIDISDNYYEIYSQWHAVIGINDIDYNLYIDDDPSERFVWEVGPGEEQFDDWKTTSSQDAHSVIGDPSFVDEVGENFGLKGDSPAKDIGSNLGADYDDALKTSSVWPSAVVTKLRMAPWDVGAYIYVPGGFPSPVNSPGVYNPLEYWR